MTVNELREAFINNVSDDNEMGYTHIICQNLQERDAAMDLLDDIGFNIGSYRSSVRGHSEYDQYLCPFLLDNYTHTVDLRTLDYTLRYCKNVIQFCDLPIYQEDGADIVPCDPNNAFASMYKEVSAPS